jgi:uncharacterized protein YjiK
MKKTLLTIALASLTATTALAQFDLGNYQVSANLLLDLGAYANDELSGVTYNQNNGRLYVVEDEGLLIFELSTSGAVLSTMALTNAGTDPEGITYIGGGEFLVSEERVQDIYRMTYSAGTTLNRAGLPTYSAGLTVGNIGLEGISYDPVSGQVIGVKEKTDQALYVINLDFPTMTGSQTSNTYNLGLLDLSDVQVLRTVPSLIGTADEENLLIYSQESGKLLEITRTGAIMSELNISNLTASAEGVTIDENGTIYIVSEDPRLIVLTPVPEPSTWALLGIGAGGTFVAWRRRKSA